MVYLVQNAELLADVTATFLGRVALMLPVSRLTMGGRFRVMHHHIGRNLDQKGGDVVGEHNCSIALAPQWDIALPPQWAAALWFVDIGTERVEVTIRERDLLSGDEVNDGSIDVQVLEWLEHLEIVFGLPLSSISADAFIVQKGTGSAKNCWRQYRRHLKEYAGAKPVC